MNRSWSQNASVPKDEATELRAQITPRALRMSCDNIVYIAKTFPIISGAQFTCQDSTKPEEIMTLHGPPSDVFVVVCPSNGRTEVCQGPWQVPELNMNTRRAAVLPSHDRVSNHDGLTSIRQLTSERALDVPLDHPTKQVGHWVPDVLQRSRLTSHYMNQDDAAVAANQGELIASD